MSSPRYSAHQLAADARRCRANAAAFRAWGKAGAPLDGVDGRPGERHPTFLALPGGGNRDYWLRQARHYEGLLVMYAKAIERGCTDGRSIVAHFEDVST